MNQPLHLHSGAAPSSRSPALEAASTWLNLLLLKNTLGYHAFLYNNGAMFDLGALSLGINHFSNAFELNNLGQVVGGSSDNACLFSNGRITNLSSLPGFAAHAAYGINDRGDIVGTADSGYGYMYRNGTMTILGPLPDYTFRSDAESINNSGQVIGTSLSMKNTWHAFLYENATMRDLGALPEMSFSSAWGINSLGQVVGESGNVDAAVWSHAFLYSNGRMIELEPGAP